MKGQWSVLLKLELRGVCFFKKIQNIDWRDQEFVDAHFVQEVDGIQRVPSGLQQHLHIFVAELI